MRTGYLLTFIMLFFHLLNGGIQDEERELREIYVEYSTTPEFGMQQKIESSVNAYLRGDKSREEIVLFISNTLYQYGYFIPNINLSTGERESDRDTLFIEAGERAVIESITLYPEDFPGYTEVIRKTRLLENHPYSVDFIEAWIRESLTLLEGEGRPFSTITLESIKISVSEDLPSVSLAFKIEKLDIVTLHTVRIKGNEETRDRVIFRQTGIFPGDTYSRTRIEEIRPRLIRTGIFRSVADPQLYMDSEGGILVINLEESRFNFFDGIVGYVPATAFESGYFTGLGHITMRNLFGTMRRLEARWQRETRHTQELLLAYREPFVAGFPINAGVSFRQRQQDSTYVHTRSRIGVDTEVMRQFSVGISFEHESVIPSADLEFPTVLRSVSNLYGVELQYDTRDDFYAPRSGLFYHSEYQTGRVTRKKEETVLSDRLQRIKMSMKVFFSPVPDWFRHVIFIGIHGAEARLTEYQVSDLFRLGGAGSLRGYREGQFTGSRIAWINSEYRYMIGRRSFLFTFFDSGYFLRPSIGDVQPGDESFKFGYGGGLQVESAIGIISVGFGFGEGDTIGTSKVHIGIRNEF